MYKKILFLIFSLVLFGGANYAFASTPNLSFTQDPNNADLVTINVIGDNNSGVTLYYFSTKATGPQIRYIGTTNGSGNLSVTINNSNASDYSIAQNSIVSVIVNGQQSVATSWPYASATVASTALALGQSSLALKAGQASTITATGVGTNSLYLSSNSSPQVANFAISGNQITVTGLTAGQTTANFCLINSSTASNCVSLYVVVQNSSNQSLSFSQNDLSIISGQNVPITITGGTGFYQVQNNTNPSLISTSLNGPTLTLYANGATGSTTVTVCSTDMNACGLVNAAIGRYTTSGTGLTLSQGYPTLTTGQTVVVNISGGYGNYYLSSNSNSSVVQTYLSTSTITLYGNNPGSSKIIVCSPSGNCGTISATVVSSYSGSLALSQNSLGLTVGQTISVAVSGGMTPYSLLQTSDGVAQYSLTGSALTVTGVSNGSSSATVCSSAGACSTLSVTVAGSGSTSAISGVQPVFSQNNFSLNTNQTTSVYLSGAGSYYISNNSNNNVVSASISGNGVVIFGVATGSANITVCQTGGQCNTLYVTVSDATASTVATTPITFDKTTVSLPIGKATSVIISGGSGSSYYLSNNSNSDAVGAYLAGNVLLLNGKGKGTGTITICATNNTCGSVVVSVESKETTNNTKTTESTVKYKFSTYLKVGSSGKAVTELQKRLKEEGVYNGAITGYFGNLTATAVKNYQKLKKLDQLGVVGPGTRAALNK